MSAQAKEGLSTSSIEVVRHTPRGTLRVIDGGLSAVSKEMMALAPSETPKKPSIPIDLLPPPSIYDCALSNPETSESERPLARADVTADAFAFSGMWEREEAAYQEFLARTEELPMAPPMKIKAENL